MRRLLVALPILATALVAGSAAAKEGVEATLLTAIPKDAAPGSTLRVDWRLAELGGRPFGAGGVFVRLLGAGDAATTAFADETAPGRFAATAVVPDGLRGIRIGLRGMRCAGDCTPADVFFRVVNDPYTDPWTPLRRPLHVPMIPYGARCPVARTAVIGLGSGPVYPVGVRGGTLAIGRASGGVWGTAVLRWVVAPSYGGPVVVRGEQIDGPFRVRFGPGRLPAAELDLPAGGGVHVSSVRVRKPGCYAFQVDGTTFSRTIVFRAVRG